MRRRIIASSAIKVVFYFVKSDRFFLMLVLISKRSDDLAIRYVEADL